MSLRYLSVCSGIEAATVAWHPLGFIPVWFAEIDPFARAVLLHHYRSVPNRGDIIRFREWPDAIVDVLVGGTPCQSFSIAGLRAGLADPRGNLALVYLAIAERYRPRWLVWENVTGVLSSNGGRDFGAILGGMVELGYGFAYRVLDAQYVRVDGFPFAVPQRRRRVIVVGHLGDWRRAAAVLFERESLCWDRPPRRAPGQRIAPTIEARADAGGAGWGTDFLVDGGLVPEVANPLTARMTKGVNTTMDEGPTMVAFKPSHFTRGKDGAPSDVFPPLSADADKGDQDALVAFSCKDYGADVGAVAPPIRAMDFDKSHANAGGQLAVAFAQNQRNELRELDVAGAIPAIRRGDAKNETLLAAWKVRRLTPRECERLQGFADDYTLVPYRGGLAADGPRYRALGNSFAVNVMRWVGRRIQLVEGVV